MYISPKKATATPATAIAGISSSRPAIMSESSKNRLEKLMAKFAEIYAIMKQNRI